MAGLHVRPLHEAALLAAIGGTCAIAADLLLAGSSSLLQSLSLIVSDVTATLLNPEMAARLTGAALVCAGGLSIFYLRPLTRKGAFAGGFATIAILAIFVP